MADALEEQVFERSTYQDYVSWDTEVRYELIDGVAYMMSAPSLQHQDILREIARIFFNWFHSKPCKVYMAPFDVRLFPKADGTDDTVVQPDLLVVCDTSKLSDGKACRGAPDFAAEVLSPGSKQLDLHVKKDKYLKAGVREYWIIDGSHQQVQINYRADGETVYRSEVCSDTAASHLFKGLVITLSEIWTQSTQRI